ncbi:MAG TPA: HlyD family efflux transporter periplasmic adaptor subunit [Tepidisphaeraceae bacterium]
MSSGIVEPTSQGSGSEDERNQNQGISRSKIVQRLLQASANLPNFLQDLLHAQALHVAGTEAAAFMLERNEQGFGMRPVAHIRPDNSSPEVRQAALQAFAEFVQPCVAQGKDGAIEVPGSGEVEPQFCLVTLLRSEGEVVAVSAVVTRCRDVERAQQRLQSMQMVAGYFDLYMLRRTSEQSRAIAQSHQHVLQLATSVATSEGFQSAAMGLCNELASRANATRVSIGWIKGNRIRVKALSHTEEFDKRQELIVELEKVMEECYDQEDVVQFEPEGTTSQNVTREAQALSRSQGGNGVISIPLRRKADIIGVLTLEFAPGQQLGPQAATGLSVAADLLAPQLYDRYQNDRWLITKTGISIREGVKTAIGPKYWIAKISIVLAIILILALCNWIPFVDLSFPYRVSSHFAFSPIERRYVNAPFEGFIETVKKRPGDPVEVGELLFSLDTRELKLKKSEAMGRANQAEKEAAKNLGDRPPKVAEAQIAMAKRDASLAEANLYQSQIDRAEVKAEMAGVLMEGDLKDKVGSPVKLGDQLMVIGQPNKLKAELRVAERDIQDVKKDYVGKLATTALPFKRVPFKVERVIQGSTQAKEGDNYFTVYVDLLEQVPGMLPGMEGEARVEVTKKPLVWIWTHRFVDWLSLKLWSSPVTSPFSK